MRYAAFVAWYGQLASTTKKLEKTAMLAAFLKKLEREGEEDWVYLLRGRVVADYDVREYGVSDGFIVKTLSAAFGIPDARIVERYKKSGDWGDIAAALAEQRAQQALFSKPLDVGHVVTTLRSVLDMSGKGAVERKTKVIAELLSHATPAEARYLVRTVLQELRVGVADALLVDAFAQAYYEGKEEMRERIAEAYDTLNDAAEVFRACQRRDAFEDVGVVPGRPAKVMLPVKVESMKEAFTICGRPAALEHKYDGFRMLVSFDGKEIALFTRKLENVTAQFPDVVGVVRKQVKAKSFILDSEVVGYDAKTRKAMPFEAISQRIKRKYEVGKMVEKLPVEINVFDVLYANGRSVMGKPFRERRALLEKLVPAVPLSIRPATQYVTDEDAKAEAFYQDALKDGEEGIIMKALDAPYKQGRRVGYMVKLKPVVKDLDLVIVGAEYGSGKRAGLLTSYGVACRTRDGFAEVGMVSSGLKEKEEEGTSYEEMTRLLKPLVIASEGNHVSVLAKLVVSVTYQNIQASPSYSSGYALRFPRITHYRPDRTISDIATLSDIEREARKSRGQSKGGRARGEEA